MLEFATLGVFGFVALRFWVGIAGFLLCGGVLMVGALGFGLGCVSL